VAGRLFLSLSRLDRGSGATAVADVTAVPTELELLELARQVLLADLVERADEFRGHIT
jgi:hypothetical protein